MLLPGSPLEKRDAKEGWRWRNAFGRARPSTSGSGWKPSWLRPTRWSPPVRTIRSPWERSPKTCLVEYAYVLSEADISAGERDGKPVYYIPPYLAPFVIEELVSEHVDSEAEAARGAKAG